MPHDKTIRLRVLCRGYKVAAQGIRSAILADQLFLVDLQNGGMENTKKDLELVIYVKEKNFLL